MTPNSFMPSARQQVCHLELENALGGRKEKEVTKAPEKAIKGLGKNPNFADMKAAYLEVVEHAFLECSIEEMASKIENLQNSAKKAEDEPKLMQQEHQDQKDRARLQQSQSQSRAPAQTAKNPTKSVPSFDEIASTARAPYRFVPVDDKRVVQPPCICGRTLSNDPDVPIDAELDIEITAHSPLCVGQAAPLDGKEPSAGSKTIPAAIAGGEAGDVYVIPGASLKGMLRATYAIASFSALDKVADSVAGLRDFMHPLYSSDPNNSDVLSSPVASEDKVNAGFLRREGDRLFLHPCPDWFKFSVKNQGNKRNLVNDRKKLTQVLQAVGGDDFFGKNQLEKYESLQVPCGAGWPQREDYLRVGHTVGKGKTVRLCDVQGASKTARLVVGGRATGKVNKRFEYLFVDPEIESPEIELTRAQIERFCQINGRRQNDADQPLSAYVLEGFAKTALCRLAKGGCAPVFYVGQPGETEEVGDSATDGKTDPKDQMAKFDFGFTRLFKVGHRYSVHDKLSPMHKPNARWQEIEGKFDDDGQPLHRYKPDMVQRLFGFVRADPVPGLAKSTVPADTALAGRVSVGFATLSNPSALDPDSPTTDFTGILMGPKSSYSPFYLNGAVRDWSDEHAQLSGRKRYPSRFLPGQNSTARREVKCSFGNSMKTVGKPSRDAVSNPSQDIRSEVAFLSPIDDEKPLIFKGKIKARKLHPVELGGILWALTFGDLTGEAGYFHGLGHAKNFGAGQVSIKVAGMKVSTMVSNEKRGGNPFERTWSDVDCKDGEEAQSYIDQFVDYMKSKVSDWSTSPTICKLKCYADAKKWKDQREKLSYLELGDHMTLKGQVNWSKNRSRCEMRKRGYSGDLLRWKPPKRE